MSVPKLGVIQYYIRLSIFNCMAIQSDAPSPQDFGGTLIHLAFRSDEYFSCEMTNNEMIKTVASMIRKIQDSGV